MMTPGNTTIPRSRTTQAQEDREVIADRVKHIRTSFGKALNQLSAISQERLAGWCGVTRDIITSVENKRTKLSNTLEAQLTRITGAPDGWVRGEGRLEEFGESQLRDWFPVMLGRKGRGSQQPRALEVEALTEMWDDVMRPMMRFLRNHEPEARLLPDRVINEFCEILRGGDRGLPQEHTLWMAFTFTTSAQQLRRPLGLGLLDAGIKSLGAFAPREPERHLPELNHALLVLLHEMEMAAASPDHD